MSYIPRDKLTDTFYMFRPQIEGILGSMGIIGASILLSDRDDALASLHFGTKDRQSADAPDDETLFMIGSCSKSFASLSLMQLCEQGLISLEDDVSKYTRFTAKKGITLRHILTHTSGIPNLGMGDVLISRARGQKVGPWFDDMDAFYEHVNGASAWFFEPGERYIYSNTNYTLAAEVTASVSGMPYEDYVRKNIFMPLSMARSCFSRAEYERFHNKSKQYFQDGTEAPAYFEPVIAGCGGIISCAADLSRYLRMYLNEGAFDGGKLIGKKTAALFREGITPMTTARDLLGDGFGPEYYGLGFMVYPDYCGTRIVTHSGSTGIGSANLFYAPELGFSLSGVCNVSAGESALPVVGFMLAAALMGEKFFQKIPYFATEAHFRSLCGEYESYRGIIKRKVIYKNGMLYLEANGNAVPLVPDDAADAMPTVFRLYNGPQCFTKTLFLPSNRLLVERNLMEKVK